MVIAPRIELASQEVHVSLYGNAEEQTKGPCSTGPYRQGTTRSMSTKRHELADGLSEVESAAQDPHVSLLDDLADG